MNIEEKIRNNREAFDDVKMPEGSRERFEAALNSSFRAKRSEVETRAEREHSPMVNKSQTIEGDFSVPLRSSRNDGQKDGSRNDGQKRLWLTWTSIAAAAAIAAFVMIAGLKFKADPTQSPQVAENQKLVEMRQMYDEKVEEAIINLEDVMENVDDSTKMQINAVIRDLMNMGDMFAEMAPMPEDRQMAITEQMYDNKLRTLDLITEKINK